MRQRGIAAGGSSPFWREATTWKRWPPRSRRTSWRWEPRSRPNTRTGSWDVRGRLLGGGPGLQRERVDLAAYEVPEGLVDQAVTVEQGFPFELGRDDQDVVVTASRGGPGVTGVRRAVVPDLQPRRTEPAAEDRLDPRTHVAHRPASGRP